MVNLPQQVAAHPSYSNTDSMSNSDLSTGHLLDRLGRQLSRAWPHRATREGDASWAGKWPDLSAEGRQTLRESLQAQREELAGLLGEEQGTVPGEAALLHLLDRELRVLSAPLQPEEFYRVLECGLQSVLDCLPGSRVERAGALVQRLQALPAFSEAALGALDPKASTDTLVAGLAHLERWLEVEAEEALAASDEGLALLRRERPRAQGQLRELGLQLVRERRPAPVGTDAMGLLWEAEAPTRWQPERIRQRLERSSNKRRDRLRQLLGQLGKRYALRGEAEDVARDCLEQLSLDTPRLEHWQSYQNDQLRALHKGLRQCELIPESPCPVLSWMSCSQFGEWRADPRCGEGGTLRAPELDGQPLKDQEAWTGDRNTASMKIHLLREALPGRLWLLRFAEATPLRRLLRRESDLDGWASLAPRLANLLFSGAGDGRHRIFLEQEEARDLLCARADLAWHTEQLDEEGCLELLRQGMPDWLARKRLTHIQREAGRFLQAWERRSALNSLAKALARRGETAADPAAVLEALSRVADLPASWLETFGEDLEAGSRSSKALPQPIPQITRENSSELMQSVEQQLAALGRINLEDLEAGQEFDDPSLKTEAPVANKTPGEEADHPAAEVDEEQAEVVANDSPSTAPLPSSETVAARTSENSSTKDGPQ